MKKYIIDTGTFQYYFGGDLHMKEIYNEIKNDNAVSATLEANLIELFYKTCEVIGKDAARIRVKSIRTSKIKVFKLNEELVRIAGEIKCSHLKLSFVDAITAALAILLKAKLVTTDSDFNTLKDRLSVVLLKE